MVVPWIGDRRVAFVPVSNAQVDANVPSDFREQVYIRAFLDPGPDGADNSLKGYIHTVSSGRASLTGHVFPAVVANDADVMTAGLESLPKLDFGFWDFPIHGFDLAVMVLPHASGPHRGGYAWYPGDKVNGVSYYARVALYQDSALSNRQGVGVWAMETLHMICRFGDLYFSSPPMGNFDVMSCACGTHPTAYTKNQFGWVDVAAIVTHGIGTAKQYALSAVSYSQPPSPGRAVAVRINAQADDSYYLIEARDRTDRFESPGGPSAGIPTEGVIVYQVRDTTDLVRKVTGLGSGDTHKEPGEDLTIQVKERIPGGYLIRVVSRPTLTCARLRRSEQTLEQSLAIEQDISRRKQIISALAKIREQMRQLRCLPVFVPDEPTVVWDESMSGRLIGSKLDGAIGEGDPDAADPQ
jgi:hypothetical protein